MNNNTAKNDLERRIRERAYRIWVDEGKPTGKSEDWPAKSINFSGYVASGTYEEFARA